MATDRTDQVKLRRAYADLRARLIRERKREETRIAVATQNIQRIGRELEALEREQRQLERSSH